MVSRVVVRGIGATPPATLAESRFSDSPESGDGKWKTEGNRRGDLFFPVAFCSVTRDPQNGRLAACLSGN